MHYVDWLNWPCKGTAYSGEFERERGRPEDTPDVVNSVWKFVALLAQHEVAVALDVIQWP